MDGADAFAVSSNNPWSLVRGYFSPATLFLLLNMVIGTIALTSSRSHRRHHREDNDDARHYYHPQDAPPPPPPAPLARTSSVMERLRSIGIYRFQSGDFPPEYNRHLSASAGTGTTDGTAADSTCSAKQQYTRSRSEPATRPPAVRKNSDKKEGEAVVVRAAKKSTTSEVKKLERAPAQAHLQVRRAPRAPAAAPRAVAAREEEEDAAAVSVDARADDFINRFRQQLQLQRLNSLLNYCSRHLVCVCSRVCAW